MLASCRLTLLRVLSLPSAAAATTTLNRLAPALQTSLLPKKHFGVTAAALKKHDALEGELPGPQKWPLQNDQIQPPPEGPSESPREAWVVHYRSQIRYSPKKMLPIAQMIRGMSVDEAIKQLSFVHRKGAKVVMEVLREAQELAVREHNVEYRSNLWVAESFCGKGATIKGIRRHARGKLGIIQYRFCHYFVRLVEGPPPEHYYDPPLTPSQKLQEFIQELRDRRIIYSL
ncbi:mitochondrial ribosomal protein L22 [Haemaphysalis longicornis]